MIPVMILMPIATKLIRISSGNFLTLTPPAGMTQAGLVRFRKKQSGAGQVFLSEEKEAFQLLSLNPEQAVS